MAAPTSTLTSIFFTSISGSLKFFGTRRKSSSSTCPDQLNETPPTVAVAPVCSATMELIFDLATDAMIDGPIRRINRMTPEKTPPPMRRIFFQRFALGFGATGGGGGDGGADSGVVMRRAFYRLHDIESRLRGPRRPGTARPATAPSSANPSPRCRGRSSPETRGGTGSGPP